VLKDAVAEMPDVRGGIGPEMAKEQELADVGHGALLNFSSV
jgi:hypothetical protein